MRFQHSHTRVLAALVYLFAIRGISVVRKRESVAHTLPEYICIHITQHITQKHSCSPARRLLLQAGSTDAMCENQISTNKAENVEPNKHSTRKKKTTQINSVLDQFRCLAQSPAIAISFLLLLRRHIFNSEY